MFSMSIQNIFEVGSILGSVAVGYGILQGRVKNLTERVNKLESTTETLSNKIQDQAVNVVEIKANMKHVMDSLVVIENKLDKILLKED